MSDESRNTVWARAFVEEIARAGVTELCLAPGSRSTPLVLAAARDRRLEVRVHLDERSAAFFALGLGRASGRPAAVLTTSGTAVANLFPAVVEAAQAEVPLLLLTADRPHHLRDSDANQAIDQVHLFGRYLRAFFEVAPPVVGAPQLRHLRGVACRAVSAALGLPAGPVHMNFPFDLPLEPATGTGDVPPRFAEEHPRAFSGREDDVPFVRIGPRRPGLGEEELTELVRLVDGARRGVIVAGPSPDPERSGEAVLALARASGLPVLADPLSGARFRPAAGAVVVSAYDLFLRDPALRARLEPDLVLRVGRSPVSAFALRWLEEHSNARQVVLDPGDRWKDHLAAASDYLRADPVTVLPLLARRVTPRRGGEASDPWARLEERTREVVAREIEGDFFEGAVLAEVLARLPDGGRLFVSNSMPVRDLDAFGSAPGKRLDCWGNRGASGIDGIVSTALGASAAAGPLVAVLGDLAFLHDGSGLLACREPDARVVFVVVDNDGGGIFHFLPVRGVGEEFERCFGTPHGLDLSHLAALHRLPFTRAPDLASLGDAIDRALAGGGSHVIVVPSEREANRSRREQVIQAVKAALEDLNLEVAGA